MARNVPEKIPAPYRLGTGIADAYRRGWSHGHGIACHNVPEIGTTYHTDAEGTLTADAENIRDIHATLCYEAESNSRCYSPFEFTAHEFNSKNEWHSQRLWTAFDAGISDAISADLAEYSDDDYGIDAEASEDDDDA
jgi:hypothetical protein